MKKMFLKLLLFVAVLVPMSINAAENDKVKVYVFEAGGCGYCEQQIEYLEGLDSYNEKFEVIRKELYVDTTDWASGEDYDLGVKVADAFYEVGFEDASYQGTPFVIISDVYAASALNTSLESVIDEVYEEGDKDIVSCIEDGNDDCLAHIKVEDNTTTSGGTVVSAVDYTWVIICCTIAFIAAYLIKTTIDTNKLVEAIKTSNKVKKDKK